MKSDRSPYHLIRMGTREWRFEETPETREATLLFDQLLGPFGFENTSKSISALRKFLTKHPDHIDALHHFAMSKLDTGDQLEAFVFAHAAVAVARSIFPKEFNPKTHRLPGGWVTNRPFLRALHGLMVAQNAVSTHDAAIATARELIAFDPDDRMGARLSLPAFLLTIKHDAEALAVFEDPRFEGTFSTAQYLHALCLFRLKRKDEARKVIGSCLHYYPQIARFLLEPTTEPPFDGRSHFGITVGSPFEGWYYAMQYSDLWRNPPSALRWLREIAEPLAATGWARDPKPPSSPLTGNGST